MNVNSYTIISLKLLDFEKSKFERLYAVFKVAMNKRSVVTDKVLERYDKKSEVVLKFFPNPSSSASIQKYDVSNDMVKRLFKIVDTYFLMKAQIISVDTKQVTPLDKNEKSGHSTSNSRAFWNAEGEAFAPPIISAK